ncbi:hypothetical protein BC938DRAFT_474288 [Jimgerdemannia flammicorona]|uniref:Uncharacterized protein n=1 Tax=Jimgerdemannia flammicorona TaxID=994334 RepID=A0A433Q2G4_9FUNG|nr:hypothetical protein BC938DRAFT_474288 [Jimgerdemannia flammicorona]
MPSTKSFLIHSITMPQPLPQSAQDKDTNERTLFCMKELLSHQSTRVALYKEFDDIPPLIFTLNVHYLRFCISASAYKDFLADRCTPESYQSICQIVTDGFQEVSLQIQAVERALRDDLGREDLGREVRKLQELEREKLKLVMPRIFYLFKKNPVFFFTPHPHPHPPHQTAKSQIFEIDSRKGDKDYSEALRDMRTRLGELLGEINDVLSEIHGAMAEL